MQNPELPERIPEVDLDFMRALEAAGANRMDLDLLNPRRPMNDWGGAGGDWGGAGGDLAPQQLPPIGQQGSPVPIYQPPQAQADPEYAKRMQAWEQRQGQNIRDLGHSPESYRRMVDRIYAQQQQQQQRQRPPQGPQGPQAPQDRFEQELIRAMQVGNPQQRQAAEHAYLQMNLQRTALNQAEQVRLRRLEHALAAVENHPGLAPEERADIKMQLLSGIHPLEERRNRAQMLHTQAQTQAINQQVEQSARLMQRDATFWASGAQDRMETFRDEDGNILGYGITNRQGAQQFIPDTRSEQREQNALEFHTRQLQTQMTNYQAALQRGDRDIPMPAWMLRDPSQPASTRMSDGSIYRQEPLSPAELEEARERELSRLMSLRRPNRPNNQGNPAPTSTPGPGYSSGARSAAAQAAMQGRPGNNPLVPGGGGAGGGNATVEQQQRQFQELLQSVSGRDRNAPSPVAHERVRELRTAAATIWNDYIPAIHRIGAGVGPDARLVGELHTMLERADEAGRGLTQAEEARYNAIIARFERASPTLTHILSDGRAGRSSPATGFGPIRLTGQELARRLRLR